MNQFNVLNGDEQKKTRKLNIQPTEVHFKYRNSYEKHSTMVSTIMGIINNHKMDNGDVEVYLS